MRNEGIICQNSDYIFYYSAMYDVHCEYKCCEYLLIEQPHSSMQKLALNT